MNHLSEMTADLGIQPSLSFQTSKRLFDVVLAVLGMIVFAPLFVGILVLQYWSLKEKPFYRQERIGKGGQPFQIIKFRTMVIDAERSGPQLVESLDDHRLTRYGAWLRRHHLDELPQLWNVLIGNMSFVGYRPERAYFIQQIMEHDPRYALLYSSRPGITSEATIYNGYTDSMDKMLKRLDMDLHYLQHQSLLLDLKIIILTLGSFIAGQK